MGPVDGAGASAAAGALLAEVEGGPPPGHSAAGSVLCVPAVLCAYRGESAVAEALGPPHILGHGILTY